MNLTITEEVIAVWNRYRAPKEREQRVMHTPWLQTRSGRAFPLIDPEPSDVHWPDVIFALAHINRFGGHVGGYSVAQHSVIVADQLRPEWRPYGLLHDAHEAFLGDIPTPLKNILEDWSEFALFDLADDIDKAILLAADLCYPVPEEIEEAVKIADLRALMTERRDLMREPPHSWGTVYDNIDPLPERITLWTTQQSIARFMLALSDCNLTVGTVSFTA